MENIDWSEMNEDCLRHIFQFLSSIKDRMSVEGVCQIWQKTSRDHDCYRTMRTLDLSASVWGFTRCKIPAKTFHELLSKCGRYLRRINLSHFQNNSLERNTETPCIIMQSCHQLEEIDLTSLSVPCACLRTIAETYTNIITLKLGIIICFSNGTLESFDSALKMIFETNLNLQHLEIAERSRRVVISSCLSFLPPHSMHTLKLRDCRFRFVKSIAGALRRLVNLRHLTLDICRNVGKNILKVVSSSCTNLTELEFICTTFSKHRVHSLINLVNLEFLKIYNNFNISDAFLVNLVRHCVNLTYINISGCENVTDNGLANIATLEKLEKLVLNDLHRITGSGLQNIHRLKELHCMFCTSLDDKVMSMFIESSPQLQFLDISYCPYISYITLFAAINVCNNRSSNMTIIFGDTLIRITDEIIIPENLNIVSYTY